jgi:hypothetical protein
MFFEDYDLRVKRSFLGNKKMRILSQLGVPNEGLEFRLYNEYFYNDLFFYTKQTQLICGQAIMVHFDFTSNLNL